MFRVLIFSLFVFLSSQAHADFEIIPLEYGINQIDLNKDGEPEQILKLWKENYNAHSHDVYIVYGTAPDGKPNIIPIEEEKQSSHSNYLHSIKGADCIGSYVFFIQGNEQKTIQLLIATKEKTLSPIESSKVHFSFYKLTQNKKELPGFTPQYFKEFKTSLSNGKYCDVHKAVNIELIQ